MDLLTTRAHSKDSAFRQRCPAEITEDRRPSHNLCGKKKKSEQSTFLNNALKIPVLFNFPEFL